MWWDKKPAGAHWEGEKPLLDDAKYRRSLLNELKKAKIPNPQPVIAGVLKDLPANPATEQLVRELVLSNSLLFGPVSKDTDTRTLDRKHALLVLKRRTNGPTLPNLPRELQTRLTRVLEKIKLPRGAATSPFTLTLLQTLPDPRGLVREIYTALFDAGTVGLFEEVLARFAQNAPLHDLRKFFAADDTPLDRLNDTFFKDTPFHAFFETPVPLNFSQEVRFSHTHIVGGTGAGKTTLIETLLLHDLKSADRPAIVVVDSQGDLIRKVSHLAMFDKELRDALIIVSPKDVDYPPALNIFDMNRERLSKYDAATREQITAGVIQTFDYLFAGLIGADLTAKQGVFFRFVARLMLSLPETLGRNATILDIINLMEDVEPYRPAIATLPPIQRNFFERDFAAKTFAQTKEQIRYRLHAIVENPTLARLFTSPSTKLDIYTALNNRSVILVDTAKDFLRGSSAHFGQIFISLVLQAATERAVIPEAKRVPTFLYVDEAAEYFDSNIDDLLTEARKQKLGCVFAHQYLDQCTSALRASFAANTGIKFAGGVSAADARSLASELRTTPDFILGQPALHFATFIRGATPQAVSVPVHPGKLDEEPTLSEAAYEELIHRNRARVAYQETPRPPLSTAPDEDVSETW